MMTIWIWRGNGDDQSAGAQRYIGIWRREHTAQQQRHSKARSVLRKVHMLVSDSQSRKLFHRSYMCLRKAWLVATFSAALPRRSQANVIRAWLHAAKLLSSMRLARCHRLQTTQRRALRSAVVSRWRQHTRTVLQSVRVAERLHFSCRRRARERLLSSAMSAFSLCLLVCEGESEHHVAKRQARAGDNL